jgi:tetratricopeptide (TPR) repeat protein
MGCTAEPYLALTPDLGAFAYRFLLLSFSFGEAAYASEPGLSWQITVVGDPLYRPFGRPAEDLHKDLEARHNPLLAWSFLRLINLSLVNGRPVAEVIHLLEDLELSKQSSVLQEKLGDLYLKAGKPASARDSYQQALKLETTPLQRVRLETALNSLREQPKN